MNADSFQETLPDTILTSDVDQGPTKKRRRFTKGVGKISVAFNCNLAQYAVLRQFYDTDTNGGVSQFVFPHPVTGLDTYFRFDGTPNFRPIGNSGIQFAASMNWESLP